jgi:hypothetical protein
MSSIAWSQHPIRRQQGQSTPWPSTTGHVRLLGAQYECPWGIEVPWIGSGDGFLHYGSFDTRLHRETFHRCFNLSSNSNTHHFIDHPRFIDALHQDLGGDMFLTWFGHIVPSEWNLAGQQYGLQYDRPELHSLIPAPNSTTTRSKYPMTINDWPCAPPWCPIWMYTGYWGAMDRLWGWWCLSLWFVRYEITRRLFTDALTWVVIPIPTISSIIHVSSMPYIKTWVEICFSLDFGI